VRTLPLNAKAYVTLDGSGNGTASTGPQSPGEQWTGLTAHVSAATNTSEAICSIYSGAEAGPGYFGDATTWGSTGDGTSNLNDVRVGGAVFAVWTGGDPGAQATLAVTGTRRVA
jgi:hypothetical protein